MTSEWTTNLEFGTQWPHCTVSTRGVPKRNVLSSDLQFDPLGAIEAGHKEAGPVFTLSWSNF